ncbi:hypothetical protein NEOLEDRAFT_1141150 [Neolentinus lepideus HHB14362 ss-1]|uniref:Uncharacterized protein n=1 Tax=Neolentinus lepideus HHB14362 ss-1 TaxID=1314782 RepID=A0A165NVK9_9AGAM|nr:hypothetical protein NEOLEDRAFT_1141150 [Neolentinus lepideus HHB14362 ss-1]
MTNNPFIDQTASAYSRFPDISSPGPQLQSQYTSWAQPQSVPAPGFGYQPTGYVSSPYQQVPQTQGWGYNSGYAGPASPSLAPQMTGMPYQDASMFQQQQQQQPMGYGVAQQQQPQFTGYPGGAGSYMYQPGYNNTPQQQQAQAPGYLAEFDPYADVGREWQGQAQAPTQTQTPGHARSSSSSASGWKATHPREYIRQNKAQLESWDSYTWKQLENACEALKEAWAERKNELEDRIRQLGYGGGGWYGVDQERIRLQDLSKEADGHFGAIAASAFQLREVFSGYRQSSDPASRQRVREAVNAAVASMPDWPSKVY